MSLGLRVQSQHVVLGFWLRMGDHSDLSAKGNNQLQKHDESKRELAANGGMIEGGPSRQLVITLPGALAASSLTQDAREAGGTMAPLMVVARAAVLTAQHRIVTHAGCGDKAKRAGETGRGD